MNISVLTLVRGRQRHLENQLRGLLASSTKPSQWIVVGMGQNVSLPETETLRIRTARVDSDKTSLPLAAARNVAASLCQTEAMIFLDVDCVPSPELVATFQETLHKDDRLWMGRTRYLPAGAARGNWRYEDWQKLAVDHPLQPTLSTGERRDSAEYEKFWSLCFAVTQRTYALIGGFDDEFQGYGGEDTDFAFSARQADVPFGFVGATAFHQHHRVCKPPLNHFAAIIQNAIRFRDKWKLWPMQSWLDAFAERGLIDFAPESDDLRIVRYPTDAEISQAESLAPAGF